MIIYVVTRGEYSAYGIERLFSTKEKAEEFIACQSDYDSPYSIETYPVDGPDAALPTYWYVVGVNGDVESVECGIVPPNMRCQRTVSIFSGSEGM